MRSLQAAALVAGRPYPGFALAIAALAKGDMVPLLGVTAGTDQGWLRFGQTSLPLDAQGQFLIAPTDPATRAARRHSALDLIQDPSLLPPGSVVLIGSILAEAGGLRPSRIGPLHPTLHLQADGLEQLLAGTLPIRSQPFAPRLEAMTAVLGAGLAIALSSMLAPLLAVALTLALIGGLWATAFALASGGMLLDPSLPSLAIALAASSALLGKAVLERQRVARLASRMRQHLPETVVARLTSGAPAMPAELREITALFTDIEGFSALTQTLRPDQLVAQLDGYMTDVTAIIKQHGGMVDKIVGDAVHALFNAPENQRDHVDQALRCATAILHFSVTHRALPAVAAVGFGRTRIGVETGMAQLGDVGRGGFVDYTAHGNAINLAARLQDANKALGTSILIGPNAAAASTLALHKGPIIDIRSFGPVQVFLPAED